MAKKFPTVPSHPERVCWGCDHYCPTGDMRCGNGSDRTPHPSELFGEDWRDWGPAPSDLPKPPALPGDARASPERLRRCR